MGVLLFTSLAGASDKPAACDLTIAPLPQNVQLTEKAKLLTAQHDKRLTPLWAQEAIGSPEALEFLNWFDKQNPSRSVVWVPVGINDGGIFLNFLSPEKLNQELKQKLASGVDVAPPTSTPESLATRNHAYSVSTLIADPHGTGVGHRAYYSWFSNALTQRDVSSSFLSAQVRPQFVNRSIGVRALGGVDNSQDIQTIASQTVVVAASGNSFPWITDKGSYRAIIVGAVDPSGFMADFSQSGSGLTISAPGHLVLAMTGPGRMDAISGTSFAAPLVTGVLSTVASVLPGVSFEELKEMVRRTAIPSVAFSHAATWDGWGIVNQSKLLRAAHRLVVGWPGNRAQIAADWVYDFRPEVQFKKAQLQGMTSIPGCEGELARLKLLRQNFFLDPLDKETRASLAKVYRNNHYFAQSTYYQHPETNLTIPAVKKRLDSRQFQLEVSRERLQEIVALKDAVDLDVTASSNLILLAAQRGKVDIYRFLTESWRPDVMTEKLSSTVLTIARKFERWDLVQYLENRPR